MAARAGGTNKSHIPVPETTAYTITLVAAPDLPEPEVVRALRALLKFAGHRGLKCVSVIPSNPQPRLADPESTVSASPSQVLQT